MKTAEQREKILRDFAMAMSNLDAGLFGIAANAKEALAAADAIPDAPVHLSNNCALDYVDPDCPACKPAPSRAELIEVMCEAAQPVWSKLSDPDENKTYWRERMGEAYDALIKVVA